ncbi:ABC transporter permease [Polycladomyces abyssicola]|uniref:ABC transporter permease n=1 Tax=Polycladomyces abyssicola TaxID=1125966 RepID=A0A8D5UFZ1_9BACL|nr:TRAP transporter small permease [Polycladomyces abyssicola]BCU81564.1 ABC transporter permease [Polycladomyces abyssicola]
MRAISKLITKFLNFVIVFCLGTMSILVFTNVVLRYGFNSGITWSEEMARFLFIWLTFLGGIAALKDNEHLGVDTLIKRLPRSLKKLAYILSNLIMLWVMYLVLDGSLKMTELNIDSKAPATGLPLAFIYGIGVVVGVCMGVIILINLYRVIFNKTTDADLIMTRESEDELLESTGR